MANSRSFVNDLLNNLEDPKAITYNSQLVFLIADYYDNLLGGESENTSAIRRSARHMVNCGDTSAHEQWRLMRKRTPLLRRLVTAQTPPEAFVKDFIEAERQRARNDFSRAVELDRVSPRRVSFA